MNRLSRLGRLPALTVVDRAAHAGARVLPMPGAPVIPMPPHVVEAARRAAADTVPRDTRGAPELRQAIAAMLHTRQQVRVDPERELLVTHGASHALSVTLGALLDAGDEVLVPVPSYFFDGPIIRAGGIPRHVPTSPENGWRLDLDLLEEAVTPVSRAILICNPVNPTGRLHDESDIDRLVAIAQRHGLHLISDESFSDYVFDGEHLPLARRRRDHPRIISIQSLSKNYAFASWRIGYVQGPADLVARVRACLEWDAINVGPVPQAAATAALTGDRSWIDPHLAAYRGKRDLLVDLVRAAGLRTVVPAAGAALLVDFSDVGPAGRNLEDSLLMHGIAAVAGDGFGAPPTCARLLFGGTHHQIEDLGAAVRRATGTCDPVVDVTRDHNHKEHRQW